MNLPKLPRRFYGYVSVFLVVTLCLGVEWWMARPRGHERPVCAVLRPTRSLGAGQRLSADVLEVRFEPAPQSVRCDQIYFTERDLDGESAWRVRRSVDAGATLFTKDVERVAKVGLPRGKRAYSVRVENGGRVEEGDHVDLLSDARVVAGQALVLERDRGGENEFGAAGAASRLLLALRQSEIRGVEKAMQRGTLSVALVHPADVVPSTTKQSGESTARHQRRSHHSKRARIWHED